MGRFINDTARTGPWNMAVDEMLFDMVASSGTPVLRFYSWIQPTLSIGYFQPYHQAANWHYLNGAPSLDVVRRLTGGGAILHQHEITYTLIVQSDKLSEPIRNDPKQLYDSIHTALAAVFADHGFPAFMRKHAASDPSYRPSLQTNDFMCFRRHSDTDMLLRGKKIVGSAQRRRHKTILQHGTILLNSSPFLPDIQGLQTHLDEGLHQIWVEQMSASISKHLGIPFNSSLLCRREIQLADQLQRHKYSCDKWNQKR